MRICRAQWFFIAVVVFIGVAQILTACGNRGPLFLPTEEHIAQMKKQSAAKESPEDALDRLDAQEELDANKEK